MNFSSILAFIAPLLQPLVSSLNARLKQEKEVIVSTVNGLADKNANTVATVIENYVPNNPETALVRPVLASFIGAELSKYEGEFESDTGAWYDELLAKLEDEETKLGL